MNKATSDSSSAIEFRSDPGSTPSRALAAAVSAFVLSIVPVLLATGLLLSQQRDTRRDEARMLSEQAALRLGDFVRARFLALEIVRREVDDPGFLAEGHFDSLAEATQREYGGFQAINWVDADGVIRRVVPREPNLPALGRSVLTLPGAREPASSALATGEPRATGPIELMQGGRGFATYFPVVRGGATLGAINGVFRVDDLVHNCLGAPLLDRFIVVVDDDGSPVFGDAGRLGTASGSDARIGTQRFRVLDREWTLRLARRPSTVDVDPALISFAAVGFAFSLALGLAAFLAARRQALRLEAEREQRRMEQRLGRAERLEGLGRLAGGIAHDFNNLLAVVLASGEYALSRGGEALPDAVRESLEDSRTAAERAAGLTRQLLAFSREQPRAARTLDLVDALRGTERMLRRLIREDVDLVLELPSDPVWIVSDAAQLTQIVVNLVVNAADAIGGTGTIEVALEVRAGVVPREPAGQWAVLRVTDNGPGIDGRIMERIFEPFFTTKGEHEGTGLGLATVYGLLQQHDGHVAVESVVGKGATFRAFFPCCAAPSEQKAAPLAIAVQGTQGPRLTALLVEDEPLLRKTAARALKMGGFEVVLAEDGQRALDLFVPGFEPNVIVSDVVMPNMGGLELLRALRARGVEAPALLMSGYTNVDLTREELDALHATFLAKPYTASGLANATREVIARWPQSDSSAPPQVV